MSAQVMDKMRGVDFARFAEDFRTLTRKIPDCGP